MNSLWQFLIDNRISYLQNNMIYKFKYRGANYVPLKAIVDTVVQVSIGYKATLHNNERRVAA